MHPLHPVTQAVLAALVVTAAVYDLRFRRIPNWLNVTGAGLGLALNLWLGGLSGLGWAAAGLGVALLINIPCYAIHLLGAGDVKLLAAIGALAGLTNWFFIFLFTAIAGGVLGLLFIILAGRVRRTFWNLAFMMAELARFRAPYLRREELDVRSGKAARLPRAVSIAVGTIWFLAMFWFR